MEDPHVRQSVRAQTPFFISHPNCEASKNIRQIVYTFLPESEQSSKQQTKGIRGFFEKIFTLGKST
jgi:flagellar biosynthesis protein FlhG